MGGPGLPLLFESATLAGRVATSLATDISVSVTNASIQLNYAANIATYELFGGVSYAAVNTSMYLAPFITPAVVDVFQGYYINSQPSTGWETIGMFGSLARGIYSEINDGLVKVNEH